MGTRENETWLMSWKLRPPFVEIHPRAEARERDEKLRRWSAMGPTRSPRVLVENPDSAELWADEQVLRRKGFDVRTCPGPDGSSGYFPYGRCTLVHEGRCSLAEGADVVVFGLGVKRPNPAAVLRALRERFPQKPLCIEATTGDFERNADLTAGCERVPFPASGTHLVSTVEHALRR